MAKNSPEKKKTQELQAKIEKVLDLAMEYGRIDGAHHKQWAIDQMVRTLTGCPTVPQKDRRSRKEVHLRALGESEEYKEFVRKVKEGKDGPETYSWDNGISVWD